MPSMITINPSYFADVVQIQLNLLAVISCSGDPQYCQITIHDMLALSFHVSFMFIPEACSSKTLKRDVLCLFFYVILEWEEDYLLYVN